MNKDIKQIISDILDNKKDELVEYVIKLLVDEGIELPILPPNKDIETPILSPNEDVELPILPPDIPIDIKC